MATVDGVEPPTRAWQLAGVLLGMDAGHQWAPGPDGEWSWEDGLGHGWRRVELWPTAEGGWRRVYRTHDYSDTADTVIAGHILSQTPEETPKHAALRRKAEAAGRAKPPRYRIPGYTGWRCLPASSAWQMGELKRHATLTWSGGSVSGPSDGTQIDHGPCSLPDYVREATLLGRLPWPEGLERLCSSGDCLEWVPAGWLGSDGVICDYGRVVVYDGVIRWCGTPQGSAAETRAWEYCQLSSAWAETDDVLAHVAVLMPPLPVREAAARSELVLLRVEDVYVVAVSGLAARVATVLWPPRAPDAGAAP